MNGTVVIVDYGMGNLNSIQKKLQRLKVNSTISSDPGQIENADKLILPGIGHFQHAIDNMNRMGIIDMLNEKVVINNTPILGICLGMQLMAKSSEEGGGVGFGWIDAEVVRFKVTDTLKHKIPHIGWNNITHQKSSLLMKGIQEDSEFYFVHSYHMKVNNDEDILNKTDYEYTFTSAIEKNNIFGVQYHPEKSFEPGELLLKNFIEL